MFNTASYILSENRAVVRSQILNSLSTTHRELWYEYRELSPDENSLLKKNSKVLLFLFIAIILKEAQEVLGHMKNQEKLDIQKFAELSRKEEIQEILHLFRINNAAWDD